MTGRRNSGIYIIVHRATGRVYVGSAVDVRRRARAHGQLLAKGNHSSVHLQRAWDKYGAAAFEFVQIEDVPDNSQLLVREQAWIDSLKAASARHGFNINPTAGSNLGRKFGPYTPERSAKISAANRRRVLSAETRAKIAAAHRGKKRGLRGPMSLAQRQALSAARKGSRLSPEHKAKLSAAGKGRPKPLEWREKIKRLWAEVPAEARRARVAPMMNARHRGKTHR